MRHVRVMMRAVPELPTSENTPESAAAFDDAAIARLRLAAEEVAWLTGRGYPLPAVSDFVAAHHQLTAVHRGALARGTCSEPQYRRRAARELEAEDVARRPLAVDAVDVVATIEAALAGAPVLQTLDGTARTFDGDRASYAPGPSAPGAITRLVEQATSLRPSLVRFVIDERARGAADLHAAIEASAKKTKLKVEAVVVPEVRKALKKERQIVTGDADTLDVCAGWYNLVGRVLEGIPAAKVVRLQ